METAAEKISLVRFVVSPVSFAANDQANRPFWYLVTTITECRQCLFVTRALWYPVTITYPELAGYQSATGISILICGYKTRVGVPSYGIIGEHRNKIETQVDGYGKIETRDFEFSRQEADTIWFSVKNCTR